MRMHTAHKSSRSQTRAAITFEYLLSPYFYNGCHNVISNLARSQPCAGIRTIVLSCPAIGRVEHLDCSATIFNPVRNVLGVIIDENVILIYTSKCKALASTVADKVDIFRFYYIPKVNLNPMQLVCDVVRFIEYCRKDV